MRRLPAFVAVLLAAAIGFALSTLNTSVKRAAVAYKGAVRNAGHYRVAYDSVGIGFSPLPCVVLRGFVIEGPGRDASSELVRAPAVRVMPRLLPMLVGLARVASVDVESPTITVKRLGTGRVTMGKWIAGVGEDESLAVPIPLHVRNGTLVWEEDHEGAPLRWVSKSVRLDVKSSHEDGTTPFFLQLEPTGPSSRIRVDGSLRPTGEKTKGVRVDLRYAISGLEADKAQLFPRIGDAHLTGALELEGEAHGYAGAVRTESVPAEKLTITAKGNATLAVKQVRAPLSLDMVLSDKEGRLRFEKTSMSWNGIDAKLTGWTEHFFDQRASFRLHFAHADTDGILERFGVAERWRPRAMVSGEIRMEGTLNKPLMQYTAETDGIKVDFYDGYPVEVGRSTIKGILLQSSADLSAVVKSPLLRVGPMRIEPAVFGFRYWRNKLSVNMANVPLWDGTATVSGRYEPEKANAVEAAGLFDDLDAAIALKNVFPGLEPEISGRMDAIVQLGSDDNGTWAMGRIGVHRGRFGGFSLASSLLGQLADRPGLEAFAGPEVAQAVGGATADEDSDFRTVRFDFKSRRDGFDLGSVRIVLDGLVLQGSGAMDAQGGIDVKADMALSRRLVKTIVRKSPDLGALVTGDGAMHVPVRLQGKLSSLRTHVDERFLDAAGAAVSGRKVSPLPPFQAAPALEIELPKLEEQYGR